MHVCVNQSAWGGNQPYGWEEALCETGSLEAVAQAVCKVGAGAVWFSVSFLFVFFFG